MFNNGGNMQEAMLRALAQKGKSGAMRAVPLRIQEENLITKMFGDKTAQSFAKEQASNNKPASKRDALNKLKGFTGAKNNRAG